MRFPITIAAASAILFSLASPALARPSSSYNLARRADDVANDTMITTDLSYTANTTNMTNSTSFSNGTESTEEYEDCEDEDDIDPSSALNSTSPTSSSASSPSQSAVAGNGEEEEDCEEYDDDDESFDDSAPDLEDEEEYEDENDADAASSTPAYSSAASAASAPSSVVSDKVLAGVPPAGNPVPSPSALYSASKVASNPATPTDAQGSDEAEGCGPVSQPVAIAADVRQRPFTLP